MCIVRWDPSQAAAAPAALNYFESTAQQPNKKRTANRHRSISTLHIINVSLYFYIFCILIFLFLFSAFNFYNYRLYLFIISRSLPFFIIGFNHNFCYCCCCCFDCTCCWRERNGFAYTMKCTTTEWINHINSLCGEDVFSANRRFLPHQISGFLCSHVCNQSPCLKDSVAGAQSMCTRFRCRFFFFFFASSRFDGHNSLLQCIFRLITMLFPCNVYI